MRYMFAAVSALLLNACSGENHDRYIGLWKLEEGRIPAIIQISKEDNKTFILKENILKKANNNDTFVLNMEENDTLSASNGQSTVPLVLSEDGKTLRVHTNTFHKISEQELEAFENELVENEHRCKALESEFKEQVKQLSQKEKGNWDYRYKLRRQFSERAKNIPYCQAFFF